MSDVFNSTEIETLKEDFKTIKDKAFKMITETEVKPRIFEESGETTTSKYWKKGTDLIM